MAPISRYSGKNTVQEFIVFCNGRGYRDKLLTFASRAQDVEEMEHQ